MFALLAPFLSKFGVIAAGLAALVAAGFGLFKAGHSIGTANAKAQAAQANATVAVAEAQQSAAQQVQVMKDTSDVQKQVTPLDSAAVADSLREFERPAENGVAAVPGSNAESR